MRKPCKIDGCERESAGRGWCQMHWQRWRKYGDPMFVKRSGVDFNVKATCSVDGCEKPHHALGFCNKHHIRFKKYGNPFHVEPTTGRPPKGEYPSWYAIHKRLSRERGPASDFDCVDCEKRAEEWSYDYGDARELESQVFGSTLAYSLDLRHYFPRCVQCHRRYDAANGRARERH